MSLLLFQGGSAAPSAPVTFLGGIGGVIAREPRDYLLWPVRPQEVMEVTLQSAAVGVATSTRGAVVGTPTRDLLRQFSLRFSVVTSAEARAMVRFFRKRRGAYEAFDFLNPNDNHAYLVRFDSGMQVDYFTPAFFRTNELLFTVVAS